MQQVIWPVWVCRSRSHYQYGRGVVVILLRRMGYSRSHVYCQWCSRLYSQLGARCSRSYCQRGCVAVGNTAGLGVVQQAYFWCGCGAVGHTAGVGVVQ